MGRRPTTWASKAPPNNQQLAEPGSDHMDLSRPGQGPTIS